MPVALFPPGRPFTLQLTPVFVVFVTVAVNVTEFPSRTVELDAETVTTMLGGGGGGGVEVTEAAPLLQPDTQNCIASSTRSQSAPVLKLAFDLRERGRMTGTKAGEGPAKEIGAQSPVCGFVLQALTIHLA